jgi:hypothetical protein
MTPNQATDSTGVDPGSLPGMTNTEQLLKNVIIQRFPVCRPELDAPATNPDPSAILTVCELHSLQKTDSDVIFSD